MDQVGKALFRILFKLGVVLPLRHAALSADQSVYSHPTSKDVLVIMRLPKWCTTQQQAGIDSAVEEMGMDCREVTLKWRFDPAGAPYGLVERLISSCHVIGQVEKGLCWRYGALFKSHSMTKRRGNLARLYTFVIRYEPGYGVVRQMLAVRIFGPPEDKRVWVALQYVASTMVVLSQEMPGVRWEGWPECPKHGQTRIYLAPPGEVRRAYDFGRQDVRLDLF